jgi:hypothetical protein
LASASKSWQGHLESHRFWPVAANSFRLHKSLAKAEHKRHRAKAQQVVRVERVTVNEGGQAIVGPVQTGGRECETGCPG